HVVLGVARPVVGELLPHEPRVQVRDGPVPVVDVGERRALPELAVLPRAGARDDAPAAVPARRLPGRRQRAAAGAVAHGAHGADTAAEPGTVRAVPATV